MPVVAVPGDPDLAGRLLEELTGWLAAVYLRYPDGADHLPECWMWHPDVLEELLWLMHAWAAAYPGHAARSARSGTGTTANAPGWSAASPRPPGRARSRTTKPGPGGPAAPPPHPTVPGTDSVVAIAPVVGHPSR